MQTLIKSQTNLQTFHQTVLKAWNELLIKQHFIEKSYHFHHDLKVYEYEIFQIQNDFINQFKNIANI